MILRYANFSVPLIKGSAEQSAQPEAIGLSNQASLNQVMQSAADDGAPVKPWRVTDEQRALAFAVFASGDSVGAGARAAGIGYATAHQLLAPLAEAAGRQLKTWNEMSDDELEEAVQLRGEGWTLAALGQRYGVSRQAVTRRLEHLRDPGS